MVCPGVFASGQKGVTMRLILKSVKLFIALVLEIVILALNVAAWVFAKISGLVFIVMGICVFVAIYEQWWRSLGILAGIVGVGVILFFGSAFLSGELIYWRDRLLGRQKEVALK